jgi:hypothetical protein
MNKESCFPECFIGMEDFSSMPIKTVSVINLLFYFIFNKSAATARHSAS